MPTIRLIDDFILTPPSKPRSKYAFESMDAPKPIANPEVEGQTPNLSGPVCIRVLRCDGRLVSLPRTILDAADAGLEDCRTRYRANPWKKDSQMGRASGWRMMRSRATGLPAYLRGQLKVAPLGLEQVQEKSLNWLTEVPLVRALLGVRLDPGLSESEASVAASEAFKRSFPDDIQPRIITWSPKDMGYYAQKPRYHVRRQQWHGDWPVFGGAIVAHMTQDDTRVSCTNSFFPIPADKGPKTYAESKLIGADKAIERAQRALQHYVARKAPRPARGNSPVSSDSEVLHRPLDRLTRNRIVFRPIEQPLKWSGDIRCYADRPGRSDQPDHRCVWLPFAGDYRLSYEVLLTNPKLPETWSVFVDALTGDVLGRPVNLACFAPYFRTSKEALNRTPSDANPDFGSLCAPFISCIKVAKDDAQRVDPDFDAAMFPGLDFEATNVVIHAWEMYDHLIRIGMKPETFSDRPERRLSILINAGITNFNPGATGVTPTINFRHDEPKEPTGPMDGITDSRGVYDPVFDPEVIYHEVAHGLLWALNPDPFEHHVTVAPFARSLIEGYANYFARSLGAIVAGEDGVGKTHWAEAAFRPTPNEWADTWAFAQSSWDPDKEALVGPNLYPRISDQSLAVYDVGMIWARLLWDLRQIVGWKIADRLALNAFLYAQGWVASFELVAEGLLELLDLDKEVRASADQATGDDALQPLLAYRRIVAQRGIQAVASVNNAVLIGSDAGLIRSNDGGATWGEAEATDVVKDGDAVPLKDVIAITAQKDVGGTIVAWYAATENGIFRRKPTDGYWHVISEWQLTGRPLSLACEKNYLYIGTTAGVQMAELSSGATLPDLVSLPGLPVGDLPIGMVCHPTDPSKLYVAGISALEIPKSDGSGDWVRQSPCDPATDLVTCLAVAGDSIFVGTANLGVREFKNGDYLTDNRAARSDWVM